MTNDVIVELESVLARLRRKFDARLNLAIEARSFANTTAKNGGMIRNSAVVRFIYKIIKRLG